MVDDTVGAGFKPAPTPEPRRRRSIRLRGYDYAHAGAYFVTICTRNRTCLFGDLVDGAMRLNEAGIIVQATWGGLPDHYGNVRLDAFVVMPNHVHAVIVLTGGVQPHLTAGAAPGPAATETVDGPAPVDAIPPRQHGLPEVVRGFKTFSARSINVSRDLHGHPVWQRNYYEHIIRDEDDLNRIRQYIIDNPMQWAFDHENPAASMDEPEPAWCG